MLTYILCDEFRHKSIIPVLLKGHRFFIFRFPFLQKLCIVNTMVRENRADRKENNKMGDKGKADKGKREDRKKAKLTIKEKRKVKEEKKQNKSTAGTV